MLLVTTSPRLPSLAVLAGALILCALAFPEPASAQTGPCAKAVQGRIAWDYKGNRKWAANNVKRLCAGATDDQPARCFQTVMHKNVNYGGGTQWKWENAIDLCERSWNAKRTVKCFKNQIARGVAWKQAIQKCDERAPRPRGNACEQATQGKIAWDYKGNKKWAANNIKRLCTGATNDQAARCFQKVMHGKVNYGGGTQWKWENAIDLCERSKNANQTVSCFKSQIGRGVAWKQAIPKCDERAPPPQRNTCENATQGKIAWDYKGSKKWAANNIKRLCAGAPNDQPARCFQKVMHGKVNYGGGTQWKWENAIDLCERSKNANQTVSCFKGQIGRGVAWKQAIPKCDERAPARPKITCEQATQGKIAWDYKGSKTWAAANIKRLCAGAANDEPARCFQRVMHGKINYGGGTQWKWENAIDLCERSRNANQTIRCFQKKIKRGRKWKQAIAKCGK